MRLSVVYIPIFVAVFGCNRLIFMLPFRVKGALLEGGGQMSRREDDQADGQADDHGPRCAENEVVYVAEAKRRARNRGLDPNALPMFGRKMSERELQEKKSGYSATIAVIDFFVDKLLHLLQGTPIIIVVTDDDGWLLDMAGDETIMSTVIQLGIQIGVQFTEQECGPNGVNLALLESGPVRLVGSDHYSVILHGIACYTVPFHDIDTRDVMGTISIMMAVELAHPSYLTTLVIVVDSVERELILRRQNLRLNVLNDVVIDTIGNGVIITDDLGIITEFNTFAEKVTGTRRVDVVGQSIKLFPRVSRYLEQVIQRGVTYDNLELTVTQESSPITYVCLFDAFPLYDRDQRLIGAFCSFRDITERFSLEEKLSYLAYHDELTGLANRRFFLENLASEIQSAQAHHKTLAILYVDLDNFKIVNDRLGHQNGDGLLKEAALRIKNALSPEDMVARMGGDEFIILLKDPQNETTVRRRVKRILKVFSQRFAIKEFQFHVTPSIGIALYPEHGQDAESLMTHADMALYSAKKVGKNIYALYSHAMNEHATRRFELETSLQDAIKNNELLLFYQPQLDLQSGQIIGAEALLRWQRPGYGLVPPSEFIPAAEETGLIVPFGEWALREACRQNKEWQEKGFAPIRVSVNLSALQFHRSNLALTVGRALTNAMLSPQYLELEITESMTADVEQTKVVLDNLNQLGVSISIDDFGTGFSSLTYLREFAIQRLKIDRSFIRDIDSDSSCRRIVSAIISMARHLRLEVIAEGVETEEQLSFLRDRSCDYAQGFLFGRPLSPKQFEDFINPKYEKEVAP